MKSYFLAGKTETVWFVSLYGYCYNIDYDYRIGKVWIWIWCPYLGWRRSAHRFTLILRWAAFGGLRVGSEIHVRD